MSLQCEIGQSVFKLQSPPLLSLLAGSCIELTDSGYELLLFEYRVHTAPGWRSVE